MSEGFMGRWSQRKADVRQGRELAEPVKPLLDKPAPVPPVPAAPALDPDRPNLVPIADSDLPPTLQDAQNLGLESDYTPFLARRVDPAVRNAAMKKLFTDPHFNVMDRLDTYIDDYSQPDPLPLAMLRKMASAQFLNLLDEEPDAPACPPIARQDHADTDLRLQQDHAPADPGPERSAE
jgi:hypothetical protein